MMPRRIQLKRSKGWRLPEGARSCARPSRYGNPYRLVYDGKRKGWSVTNIPGSRTFVGAWGDAAALAKDRFRTYVEYQLDEDPHWLDPLRGVDLACVCAPSEPCHVDVLLELANNGAS